MGDPDFHAPRTLDDAVLLLADLKNASLVSGGQWVVPRIRSQDVTPDHIVTTQHLEELRGIRRDSDHIIIGAAETHDAIATSSIADDAIPALAALASRVGDQQVRNRGTLGGALASDAGRTDYGPALLALDGVLTTSTRELTAREFLTDDQTARLSSDEILISVRFRIAKSASYQKLAHPAANFAEAGLFVSRFENGEVRFVVSGKDQWPIRLTEAERLLAAGHTDDISAYIKTRFHSDPFFASRLSALFSRVHE
ncbi:MAG: FAD binding domain-containing protein [Pseudomonadota bacterium]